MSGIVLSKVSSMTEVISGTNVSVWVYVWSSGVTPLKCGEIYHMDFVVNFMESTK